MYDSLEHSQESRMVDITNRIVIELFIYSHDKQSCQICICHSTRLWPFSDNTFGDTWNLF